MCVFIVYSPQHKAYMCLHPLGRVCLASHVKFNETTIFPFSSHSQFKVTNASLSPQVSTLMPSVRLHSGQFTKPHTWHQVADLYYPSDTTAIIS